VIFSGQQNGYGNVVIIDHGGGFTTLYGHQSRLAAREGQTLPRGGLVGYVGSTGHSTGPHLHFETRYGGSPRNPRLCLP
jgi:murein DD-endopeptidase MepM/ murein hydrolase activator NlpD